MLNKVIIIFISIVFFSCSNNTYKEIGNIVEEWTGKTIKIPDIKPTTIFLKAKDSLKYVNNAGNKKYTILLYTDSTGCTKCKLRLPVWKTYIEKLYSKVDFLFYMYPKSRKELLFLLEHEEFTYPVFIDDKDELNKLNKLPVNSAFQCFLLDKDNKVLVIGNPTNNPKIWELYKKTITGEISDKPPVTTIEIKQTAIELKDLQAGKTSEAVFVLKNTGTNSLVIQQVESSCGCTVPEWEKQPIAAGKSTEIKVNITPEKSEYFNKTVTVHCNSEKGRISLKVKGIVED
jgi:hypothetical protein